MRDQIQSAILSRHVEVCVDTSESTVRHKNLAVLRGQSDNRANGLVFSRALQLQSAVTRARAFCLNFGASLRGGNLHVLHTALAAEKFARASRALLGRLGIFSAESNGEIALTVGSNRQFLTVAEYRYARPLKANYKILMEDRKSVV